MVFMSLITGTLQQNILQLTAFLLDEGQTKFWQQPLGAKW